MCLPGANDSTKRHKTTTDTKQPQRLKTTKKGLKTTTKRLKTTKKTLKTTETQNNHKETQNDHKETVDDHKQMMCVCVFQSPPRQSVRLSHSLTGHFDLFIMFMFIFSSAPARIYTSIYTDQLTVHTVGSYFCSQKK